MTEPRTDGATRQDVGDTPVGTLVAEVAQDLSTLVRQELELAKAETRQEVARAGKAAGALGGAGVAGLLAAVFVSLAVMFALDAAMPIGWAALIVAIVWAIAGAVLFTMGRRKLAEVNPVPEKTIETVKEDVRWVQNRNS